MMSPLPILAAAQAPVVTEEFIFAAPERLWLLVLLLPLALLRRRRGAATGTDHPTVHMIAGQLKAPSRLAGLLGPICSVLAAAALIVAIARPQWKISTDEKLVSGIDIMIACDLSGSMTMNDMSFVNKRTGKEVQMDRLKAAQLTIRKFIESRPHDRIGLVAFAGKTKLCCPLTLDHDILLHIVDAFYVQKVDKYNREISKGFITTPGTAIGSAIGSAAVRLNERKETKSKVIILVTDGANNAGLLDPVVAAEQAARLGIRIFPIAIGRDDQISQYTAQVDIFDSTTLEKIARITGGDYYRADSGGNLVEAFRKINKLEKTEEKVRRLTTHREMFDYALGVSALLLVLGSLLRLLFPRPAP